MTRYEQTMYERDLPQIREALTDISKSLKEIITIISDPGDEVDHIYDAPKEMEKIWGKTKVENKSIFDVSDMD